MAHVPDTEAGWLELIRENQRGLWAETARIGGGEVIEAEGGVLAAIVPASPDRSVFNAVLYRDGVELIGAIDQLAQAYRSAGVRAWTVWVPEDDRETARALEDAGHVLDAEPRAMAARIDDLDLSAAVARGEKAGLGGGEGPYEFAESGPEDLARLNELAYGLEPGQFAPISRGVPEAAHLLFAAFEGEPVSSVIGWDAGDDCEICWVATHPDHRGHGLAGALMARAVRDAADRGRVTTTLQASRAGKPVYEALGYRDYGALQMWERREGG